jgi:Flp pilus assembly protein TadG
MRLLSRGGPTARRAAAAVEMAILLPFLAFVCVLAIDFARIFYFSQTLETCARNGALYMSDPYVQAESPYKSLQEAALADASNLNDPSNPATVSSANGVSAAGDAYVEVTVSYTFRSITNYPGIPTVFPLSRKVRMAVAPPNPTN